MYNAIDLSLFEIYISLEMRINKYIFEFIVLHVLHIVFVLHLVVGKYFYPFYSSDVIYI